MTGTPIPLTVPTKYPLTVVDQFGLPHVIVTGGAASSDTPSVATAALSPDGQFLILTPVAAGDFVVTVTDNGPSTTFAFEVQAPIDTTIVLGKPIYGG